MRTIATYNGITFYNVLTREFDQDIVYDASGTDYVGSRFKIRLEGEIHVQADVFDSSKEKRTGIQAGYDSGYPNNSGAKGLPKAFRWISHKLAEPRKIFLMYWAKSGGTAGAISDDDICFAAHPSPGISGQGAQPFEDCENGPHPRGLSVLRVTANSIKVQFSIECFLSQCTGPMGEVKGPYRIINNKWSIAEGMDHDLFITRRIAGQIKFAEGLTHKHAYKSAVVPGLESGFKRVSIEYESAANGFEATYAVVDKQVHYSAPWPATSMEVTHSYSTNDALTWLDQCDVTLYGSPAANRQLLLSRMIQIMDARCEGLRVVNDEDKQYMLENVVITEHFGEQNFVNGTLVVKHFGESTRITLGNIFQKKLGQPLETDPGKPGGPWDKKISRVPALYGEDPHGKARDPSAFLFLLNCFQQDPCSPIKFIFGASVASSEQDEGGQKPTPPPYPEEKPVGAITPGNDQQFSQEQKQAMYTLATIQNRYVTDRLRVMMPVSNQEDGISAIPVDLASGATIRELIYDAERVGQAPDIPELSDTYTDGTITGYLLGSVISPQPPGLAADGHKKIHRVRVVAHYGLNRAVTNEALACGVLPFTSFSSDDTKFQLGQTQSLKLLV